MQTIYFSESLGGVPTPYKISDPNSAARTRFRSPKQHLLTSRDRDIYRGQTKILLRLSALVLGNAPSARLSVIIQKLTKMPPYAHLTKMLTHFFRLVVILFFLSDIIRNYFWLMVILFF